jgi:arylsulfatase A-like enzyme
MHQSRRAFLKQAAALPAAGALRAAAAPRPNILFLFPDQHRYDWTGASREIPVRTPHLDALARRGTRFTRAIVASPVCAPSRACLAAGKEYDRCRVPGNGYDFPLDQQTYYGLLRESGYHVAGCGKLDLHKKTPDWGLDGKRMLREWGFSDGVDNAGKRDAVRSGAEIPKDPYMAYLHRRGLAAQHVADFRSRKNYAATFPTPLPEEAYCDNWLAQNGLDLLRAAPAGKPWHLVVNFTGPHEPVDITRRMEAGCRGVRFPQPNRNTQFPGDTHVAIRQNYSAMVENIDRWLGIYVDELRRRGELDHTVIVFSSDHGEMLGDHDRWGKSVPYQQSVGVPLVAAGPGIRAETSDALVTIMDLAATFLDYGGVAVPSEMDSRSLRPLLEGRARSHREYLLSGLGAWRMAWDGRYKLVDGFDAGRDAAAGRLLFDLDADPLENTNLAARLPRQVEKLAPLLKRRILD